MDKDQLVDKMLEMCGYLSSYSDACKATVLDNFDLIYKYDTIIRPVSCLYYCSARSYTPFVRVKESFIDRALKEEWPRLCPVFCI